MARQFSTVIEFIQYGKVNSNTFGAGVIEFEGFNSIGDGGASRWQRTGVTGLTPSRTPTNLDSNEFTDAVGDKWELIPSQIITFNGVQFLPLPFGGAGNGGYYFNGTEFVFLASAADEAAAAAQSAADATAAAQRAEDAAASIEGQITTTQLINSNLSSLSIGDTIETNGFTTAGDGGGAQWLLTSNTNTPSQSPAQLGDAKLIDAGGRVWELSTPPNGVVQALSLGATDGGNCSNIIYAAANSGKAISFNDIEVVIDDEVLLNKSFSIFGNGVTFRASDDLGNNFTMLTFRNAAEGVRDTTGGIYDVNFKGNSIAPVRWLQTLEGGPITDPEADYISGTGALAEGVTGVEITAEIESGGVSNVTLVNGGSGFKSHPTHPYQPNTVQLTFDGDGFGARGYATISGSEIVDVTLTKSGYDYTTPPTVTVAGGYADISLLVEPSVNRRNPNHTDVGNFILLRGVYDFDVKGCSFSEHVGRAIFEQGGFNVNIEHNLFDGVGKSDQAFHAIYSQSYGTPGSGTSFYLPSENIKIKNNIAKNLERSFALFSPTKGGELSGNYIDGWGESCIFVNSNANYDGGEIHIKNNTFKNGVVTDIVCEAVEPNAIGGVFIEGNTVEGSEGAAFGCAGLFNSMVSKNILKNNYKSHHVPYGPFSERYSFNNGDIAISGDQRDVRDGQYMTIGTFTGSGNDNISISSNTIVETRDKYPNVFSQVKSGGDSLSTGLSVHDNMLSVPSGMRFIDTEIANVWHDSMPLSIRNNLGHASESTVIVSDTISDEGTFTVECGFRPSKVDVYCSDNNFALGRVCVGSFSWIRGGGRNDFSLTSSFDSNVGSQVGFITPSEVLRLTTASNSEVLSAEFLNWTETGFKLNITYVFGLKRVRFVCTP